MEFADPDFPEIRALLLVFPGKAVAEGCFKLHAQRLWIVVIHEQEGLAVLKLLKAAENQLVSLERRNGTDIKNIGGRIASTATHRVTSF